MSNEDENSQDREDTAPPYGEGLWEDVRFWFDAILSAFGDLKELAFVGVTRSLAVKLCNWLWGVEGAVRRLILAEALKLDPESLGKGKARPAASHESSAPRTSPRRRPSFRILGFISQDGSQDAAGAPSAASPEADPPERWHIRFPSDPLLAIGERPKRKRTASLRRINPLDRVGLSRSDPDYWLYHEEDPYAAFRPVGWSAGRPSRPRPESLPLQDRPGYLAIRDDAPDWRRVEEEWQRVIPAPGFAARIFALAGIMDRREHAAQRVARMLQRRRERIAGILSQPAPELSWPEHARQIHRCREVETLVPRSHAELLCLDTS